MNALELRGLAKTYGNGKSALRGIDLDVAQSEFFGLLGPNGAGKSTTIGIIASLVRKTAGTVRVFGIDIDRDFQLAKMQLGLVPQEFNFSQFESPRTIVVNQAGFYGVPRRVAEQRAERYLRQLGLWAYRNEQSRTLSGGLKRRLMIARALVHEPRLLILDEPSAGVDIELRRSLWEFLREINAQGTTIILTTHYLEEAESLCRRIAIIDQGTIIENTTTRDLLARLAVESFVCDLAAPLTAVPPDLPFTALLLDAATLQIDVAKGLPLNEVFHALSARGIQISSLRNKANRLEELFLRLVGEGRVEVGHGASE
ncbi:MAG: ABC transporter ATP-binding protein [Gammaproteobacteria bacterium]|nr:ABC transporter ATP-binding protein [Gammaproteobacteria bacterium]